MSKGKKCQENSELKAIRAYKLSLRGHSLQAIAELCDIPSGSVTKRIALGERLLSVRK